MSKKVDYAKSIVEWKAIASSVCRDMDNRLKKQPRDTAEENCKLRYQIKEL